VTDEGRPAQRARAPQQLALLVGLWWRHMRRRPTRLGESPKLSGAPFFLLMTLFSSGYMAVFVWQNVVRNVRSDRGLFTWHVLGMCVLGFAMGVTKGAVRLQVRGMRDDSFLDPLPLQVFARLGLHLADTLTFAMPLALVVPLAALHARGALSRWAVLPALLSVIVFITCFVVGLAAIAWARALGPPSAGRWGSYVGVTLNIAGMTAMIAPFGRWWSSATHGPVLRLANAWIGPRPSLLLMYALIVSLGALAYAALCGAERAGYDQLDAQQRAPKPDKRTRDRLALERVMMLRQGGRPLLVVFGVLVLGAAWLFVFRRPKAIPPAALLSVVGFVIYLGALQTIAHAGRAARSDLLARSFLAALPISPHQVLDGKARALRTLLTPVLLLLGLLGAFALWRVGSSEAYRIVLSMLSLYVVVDGAVSVAFLSTSIGVLGVGGAQAGSSFSTQILMLPLFATVLAPNAWAATTACIAVAAVSWESRRAARLSVRWIDDPADDLTRETTVWRALLAATSFFALQAMSYQLLAAFELPVGYGFAIAFSIAALFLALLTWRNHVRIEAPRFLPTRLWYWPVGVLAGAASGLLAHEIAELIPAAPALDTAVPDFSQGEWAAMFITTCMVAPLVEEYFFRGWLQRAIEADLPLANKKWAFAIGAVVFALAHFGTYGVPQLVLGLCAGWLYARGGGLWPGILAHALHNAVVMLLAST
jgi:uncharacterized protein